MPRVKINKNLTLRVRLSEHEMEKLKSFAARRGWDMSTVIREYIRRLPNEQETSE